MLKKLEINIIAMKHLLVSIVLIFSFTIGSAQDSKDAEVPYREVPKYADEFTSGTVAARLIDGLGFVFIGRAKDLKKKIFSINRMKRRVLV